MRTKKQKRTKKVKKFRGGASIIDKINNSLFPFWYKSLPFPSISDNKDLIKEKTWKPHLDLASDLYKNKSPLPKGTILFHGSGIINPLAHIRKTTDPFFFGLDAFIAIWYLSEWARKHKSDMEGLLTSLEQEKIYHEKQIKDLKKFDTTKWTKKELDDIKKRNDDNIKDIIKKEKEFISSIKLLMDYRYHPKLENFTELLSDLKLHNRRYYFLNIYETQEDIPYKYLGDSIVDENPLDEEECKKRACMHPQFGYHLYELEPPVELSMEFTIPANQIGNKLKLVGVYVIDVFKLNENKEKTFLEFKATEAIVLKTFPSSNLHSQSKSQSKSQFKSQFKSQSKSQSKSSSRKVKSI